MDRGELEALVQRGYRYAHSLVRNEDDARDLVQDACLALTRAGGPWHRGYLFQTIRNRWVDQHRRSGRVGWRSLDEPSEETGDAHAGNGAAMSGSLADPRMSDLERLISDEAFDHALDRLRPHEREVLYLLVVEELPAREVGVLVGRSRAAVLSIALRAKTTLRAWLVAADDVSHR